ncbi:MULTISPECIES: GAF and ANTAR domain-containing protein [Streptomyces]|uniref:Transcriptional regulator n=1 Tax=Streptomyces lasiicapitis TaxID=1923961 RepID=A0ABQ2LR66_9ACTN|nr:MULTISPECIES: GAF and ANTAR domain-containing protein [Streptomyces]QIB47588.1 GAF and ANTAR domain-containing protein [Streptomyces aureoverticillatus]GGO42314.1 transcriptional regulator [Streptomyces lasiicapitis]
MPELPREEQLAAAFVDLADTLVQDFDVIGFLHSLAEHCVALLDVAAAGVLLATPSGQLVDAAASDERTRQLELASIEWGEGPCRDCFRTKKQIPDAPLATQSAMMRWPRFAPRAVELGFSSVVAAPLRLHDQVIGALNLFRDRPGPLADSQVRLGQTPADTATIGVLQQRAVSEQMTVTAQLQSALDSRVIIEQAKGYLANRRGTGVEEAFTLMRRYARDHRTRLTEIARQILQGTADTSLLTRRDQ